MEMAKMRDGGRVLSQNWSQSSRKTERCRLWVFGVNPSKQRKDEQGDGKDWNAMKKAQSGAEKALSDDSKRGSGPMLDSNKDCCEDGVPHVDESNMQDEKKEETREAETSDPVTTIQAKGYDGRKKLGHILVVKASQGSLSDKVSKEKFSGEAPLKGEQSKWMELLRTGSFSNIPMFRDDSCFSFTS